MLNLHLNGRFVQSIEVRRLGLHDFVPAQRQGLRYGHTVFIGADGVHKVPGAGMVDFKYGAGDGGAGRPAVHGVIIGAGLSHLDLAGDGGILPGDGGAAAVLHIDGLGLGVQKVALRALDLLEGVPAILQLVVNIDIALVVALIGANGVAPGVGQEEFHAVDTLAGHAVDFVNEGAPGLPVGDFQSGGLAVLYLNLVGRIVQTVALGGLQLHHLIPALFRFGQADDAALVSGVGADDLSIQLADLELDAANALPGFLVLFYDGEAAARCVVEAEGLDLAGFDLDGLGRGVQDIALHRLDLPCGDGGARGQVIDDNAAIFVGDKLAVGITNH